MACQSSQPRRIINASREALGAGKVNTDATYTTVIGSTVFVDKSAPTARSSPSDFLSIAALGGVEAEFVQYNVLAANGINPGLSDIRFTVSAVSEPASWALMIAGFVMAGVIIRRRSTAVFT
jgi:hypothetical protein